MSEHGDGFDEYAADNVTQTHTGDLECLQCDEYVGRTMREARSHYQDEHAGDGGTVLESFWPRLHELRPSWESVGFVIFTTASFALMVVSIPVLFDVNVVVGGIVFLVGAIYSDVIDLMEQEFKDLRDHRLGLDDGGD